MIPRYVGYGDHSDVGEMGARGMEIGVLADRVGFETFGPFILGASVLLLVLYEASLPRGRG